MHQDGRLSYTKSLSGVDQKILDSFSRLSMKSETGEVTASQICTDLKLKSQEVNRSLHHILAPNHFVYGFKDEDGYQRWFPTQPQRVSKHITNKKPSKKKSGKARALQEPVRPQHQQQQQHQKYGIGKPVVPISRPSQHQQQIPPSMYVRPHEEVSPLGYPRAYVPWDMHHEIWNASYVASPPPQSSTPVLHHRVATPPRNFDPHQNYERDDETPPSYEEQDVHLADSKYESPSDYFVPRASSLPLSQGQAPSVAADAGVDLEYGPEEQDVEPQPQLQPHIPRRGNGGGGGGDDGEWDETVLVIDAENSSGTWQKIDPRLSSKKYDEKLTQTKFTCEIFTNGSRLMAASQLGQQYKVTTHVEAKSSMAMMLWVHERAICAKSHGMRIRFGLVSQSGLTEEFVTTLTGKKSMALHQFKQMRSVEEVEKWIQE